MLPPLGGIGACHILRPPVHPIPSFPALCREVNTHSWNVDDRVINNARYKKEHLHMHVSVCIWSLNRPIMMGIRHQARTLARRSAARSETKKRTKSDHQVPAKKAFESFGFRQPLAASYFKPKWASYCRVVSIDVKNDQHSEGKFKKSTDACSKTPTFSSVWCSSCIEHMSSGV